MNVCCNNVRTNLYGTYVAAGRSSNVRDHFCAVRFAPGNFTLVVHSMGRDLGSCSVSTSAVFDPRCFGVIGVTVLLSVLDKLYLFRNNNGDFILLFQHYQNMLQIAYLILFYNVNTSLSQCS